MELLNDELRSVLAKIGHVEFQIEGSVTIDGRNLGPCAEITSDDLRIIVDAVNRGKQLLQDNNMRITIHEFASHIQAPEEAYKFMAALTLLKNKMGTRIYFVSPFGNFTSLHYQGLIQNVFIPESKTKKEEKIVVKPTNDKSAEVKVTGTVEVKEGAKVEVKAAKEKGSSMKVEKAKDEKPKATLKPAKTETKAKTERTSKKRK